VECLDQLSREQQRQSLEDAEAILRSIGADSHAWRSPELASGLEQRLARFGQALVSHVSARAKTISTELLGLYDAVRSHRGARTADRRMARAEMALRLSRWLADSECKPTEAFSTLTDAAKRYAVDGALVDWARQVLRGGEANKDLAAGYVQLVERVSEAREDENRRFAELLRKQSGESHAQESLVPVESILEQIVAKAAAHAPVLVLLLDGMSCAVFRELSADVVDHDWREVGLGGQQRLLGLSAIPSVTEVSRTSLFCGSIRRGQAGDEVAGFSSHPALLGVSTQGRPPTLFHKASLEGPEDTSLAAGVRKAIADKKQQVVGVVVNAVDDYLDKGDQIEVAWTAQHIRVLDPILSEARDAGRIVILLSDHGHVCERQTELRQGDEGARWRSAREPIGDGEIEIVSTRAACTNDGRVVVPWTEKLRYGAKRNGYHGGATPQEMVIPVGLFWGEGKVPEGLEALPMDLPNWWAEPAGPRAEVAARTVAAPKPKKPVAPTLFDQPAEATSPKAEPEAAWVTDLLASELFARQKQMAGRVRVTDDQVASVLLALASRGGTMTEPALASTLRLPAHRLGGLLAVLQRIINIEGYMILDRQESSDTVVLNDKLLRKQFELDR